MTDGHSSSSPVPTGIKLHKASRTLELVYQLQNQQQRYSLDAEYLRVYSPSAEVRGHGRGQETLQTGKKDVAITAVEAVGNYAIKLVFDDGHDSGLYSWDYLYQLIQRQEQNWQDYLRRLRAAGATRDSDVSIVKFV